MYETLERRKIREESEGERRIYPRPEASLLLARHADSRKVRLYSKKGR